MKKASNREVVGCEVNDYREEGREVCGIFVQVKRPIFLYTCQAPKMRRQYFENK